MLEREAEQASLDDDRLTVAVANALAITYSKDANRRWVTERRRRLPQSSPSPDHNAGVLARLGIPEGGRPQKGKIH